MLERMVLHPMEVGSHQQLGLACSPRARQDHTSTSWSEECGLRGCRSCF